MGAFLSIFECKQTVVDGESIELKPLPVEDEQALPVEGQVFPAGEGEEQAQTLSTGEEDGQAQTFPAGEEDGQALSVEGEIEQALPAGEVDGQSLGEIDDITFQSMIDQITQLDDIEQMKKYALNEIQLAQLAEKEQLLLAGGNKKRKRNSKKKRSSKKTVSSIRKSNRRKY